MMIQSPLARQFQAEAIAELERHPAAVIVLSRSNTSWLKQSGTPPEFLKYLDQLLQERYERLGGYVLENQGGHWNERLTQTDFLNASLVIFRRKCPAPELDKTRCG
jgi:hypothetical protein